MDTQDVSEAATAFRRISIVVPCFNEEESLAEFHRVLAALATTQPSRTFEFLFVNDGSTDGTAQILDEFAAGDPRTKVLHLARNCGHQVAVTAGLDFADGDVIVVIDADLQDPPAVIARMIEKLGEGFDICHAQRSSRRGEGAMKRFTAWLFYRLLRIFATKDIVEDSGDFRAFTRPVLEAARAFREPHRFLRGIFAILGFRQTTVSYDREPRHAGKTKYPMINMVRLAWTAVVAFSASPMRAIVLLALVSWLFSLTYTAQALYHRFVLHDAVAGWTSLVVLVAFCTGLILFSLGILGAYIGRLFEQGQRRPLYWLMAQRNLDLTNLASAHAPHERDLSIRILRAAAARRDAAGGE
jgi:dolichol-phosphate mannosyltransferase